jgi:hypothetical protein
MTVSKFPRIGRTRVDLEEAGWRWLRDGKPAALAFIGWLDIQGRRIGSAEQVWRVYGEALLAQVGPDGCAHALKVFGKPRRRLQRAV